jgi:hypothetical protein
LSYGEQVVANAPRSDGGILEDGLSVDARKMGFTKGATHGNPNG